MESPLLLVPWTTPTPVWQDHFDARRAKRSARNTICPQAIFLTSSAAKPRCGNAPSACRMASLSRQWRSREFVGRAVRWQSPRSRKAQGLMTASLDQVSAANKQPGLITLKEIRQQPELWPTTLERIAILQGRE